MQKWSYKLWKHLNKKKYASSWACRIHKHLSKKLMEKGMIKTFSPLKSEKQFYFDELLKRQTQLLSPPEKSIKDNLCLCYKKFFSLKLYENTVETLIVGSSHGFFGYKADKKHNEINAAEASQDLYYSYEIYKKFSNAPNLKNIILFYSVFSPGFVLELVEEKWRCDFYKLIYDIPYKFTPQITREPVIRGLAAFLADQENGRIDEDYVGNCDYSSFLPPDIDVNNRVRTHLKSNKRCQNQTEYVKKMVELAKEKGNRLYVVVPPHRSDYTDPLPLFEELFPDLLKLKNDVKILSFLRDDRFQDSDFGDTDHLNLTGAEKLTSFIRSSLI